MLLTLMKYKFILKDYWTLRGAPGGSWWLTGLTFLNQSLAVISIQGEACKLHFRENPVLNYLPALCFSIWVSSYKWVSEILFLANGPKTFSTLLELCSHILHQHLHQPIRTAPLWPIKIVPFKLFKLWGFGVLLCMRMNHSSQLPSGTRSALSIYTEVFP